MLQIRPTVFDTPPMRPPVPRREPVAVAIPVQQQHNRLIENGGNVYDDSSNIDNEQQHQVLQQPLAFDHGGNVHDDSSIINNEQQHDHRYEHVDDNVNDSSNNNNSGRPRKRARLA